jgi:hypothetical protein
MKGAVGDSSYQPPRQWTNAIFLLPEGFHRYDNGISNLGPLCGNAMRDLAINGNPIPDLSPWHAAPIDEFEIPIVLFANHLAWAQGRQRSASAACQAPVEVAFSASMTTVLDVPEVRDRVLRMSVADYHRFTRGQRTELLRGIVIEKMSRSPLPSFVADALREILAVQIDPEFVAFHERPLTASDSESEPDVMVVRGARSDFRVAHPTTAELVIEVAVSSLEVERVRR